ncbi:inositol polyphosphate 5-phosphatase [Myotisia sp. PD_48]|nr:inositol polyphosphate 5-phosphatase [Myotisia sp. PD_48]
MPLLVLCKDEPERTLMLVANGQALSLQYVPTISDSNSTSTYSHLHPPKCIVTFKKVDPSLGIMDYRRLGSGYGTLGLITLNSDIFICVITRATTVAEVRPGETVERIVAVEFYCLNRPDYDIVGDGESRMTYRQYQDERNYGTSYQGYDIAPENPSAALKKLLDDGSFYYSLDFNLTNRLQDRVEDTSFDIESLDEDFLWNSYMIGPLLQFRSQLSTSDRQRLDDSKILTSIIRGFVGSLTIPSAASVFKNIESKRASNLTIISRLASRRAGTRFNSRGIDDDGNVSNFVESETLLWIPTGLCFSYTQVRGSVPIFWEQSPGLIPGQQKLSVTRSIGATQPAFNKHFANLASDYGAVHAVNLLTREKYAEAELSERYHYHISRSPLRQNRESGVTSEHDILFLTEYDFHAETRGAAGYHNAIAIRHEIEHSIEGFDYFLSETSVGATSVANLKDRPQDIVLQQGGVFRTNCLDCLDRTNLVQTIISQIALEQFLGQRGGNPNPDFWTRHSTLWADNGDVLSKIYAGTGALKSSFTRYGKMSFAGAIADARKSATRLYINNFTDNAKQNTIDMLLGTLMGQASVHLFDPIKDFVDSEVNRRIDEFTTHEKILIWVGTFNLNGRSHGASEDLGPWLHGSLDRFDKDPAIVGVGFQEIVELSPQQIMSTDPTTRIVWEEAVKASLNERTKKRGTTEYVLLRSGQLVGAALLLFAKSDVVHKIKNVEGNVKKTGLSGMGGNKGGCAIRLEYYNTRICFITAHLAAGFSNYEERNRDFQTIAQGLRFQRNRTIADHDAIIWFGDFNYRIGLSDGKVRSLIKDGDFENLYHNDQLNLQMVAGIAFPYYMEGPIIFPPTYRYDNGTDNYDTSRLIGFISEKRRIPAWCDRILWRGANIRQLEYQTAPLKFSDHRPVYSIFECGITIVDTKLKEGMAATLYAEQKRRREAATTSVVSENIDEDGLADEPIAPGLPPPSSDQRLPVRSAVSPSVSQRLGSQRVVNPFSTTPDSDWIHIQRTGGNEDGGKKRQPAATSEVVEPLAKRENKPPPPPSRSTTKDISLLSQGIATEKNKKRPPPVPQKPSRLSADRTKAGIPFSPKSPASSRTISAEPARKPHEEAESPLTHTYFGVPLDTRPIKVIPYPRPNIRLPGPLLDSGVGPAGMYLNDAPLSTELEMIRKYPPFD